MALCGLVSYRVGIESVLLSQQQGIVPPPWANPL